MAEFDIFNQILGCARDNDVQGVEALLKLGCPPSFCNRMGQTAVHIGAMWGGSDAIRVLLKARADPNQRNQLRGQAPLHSAVSGRGPPDKCAECIKVLLEYRGDPMQRDVVGESPLDCAEDEILRLALGGAPMVLHSAVRDCQLQVLKDAAQQVRRGKVKHLHLDSSSGDGETALHRAVIAGWEDGVRVLLEASANPSIENGKQRAPLHTAVLSGHQVILCALLQSKANVSAKDRDLDHDFRFSSTSFKETPDDHRTALHYASSLCNAVAIKALLEANAHVNDTDSNSKTPLHLCLELQGVSDIDTGYGVRAKGVQSKPEWNGCLGVALGPPTEISEHNALCPVVLQGVETSSKGVLLKPSNLEILHEEALDLLLDAKADVNASNNSLGGRSVLHEASRLGNTLLARKLLAARARLDVVDSKNGLSALHFAARGKHADVMRLLVEAKSHVGLTASNGKTAADFLRANGAGIKFLEILGAAGEPGKLPDATAKQDTLAGLTKEQRAALFLD